MHITHSFKGSVQGKFRYSFYLLWEDLFQTRLSFVQDFDLLLQRFARDLREDGVVVQPFPNDIDTTRQHVLGKRWTEEESKQLMETPGLLVIDKDFDEFNPRQHKWVYLAFGREVVDSRASIKDYEDVLAALVKLAANPQSDFFEDALRIARRLKPASMADIFEAKPGIFGFSIDLKKAAGPVRSMLRQMRRQTPRCRRRHAAGAPRRT